MVLRLLPDGDCGLVVHGVGETVDEAEPKGLMFLDF
jgi:hypothetical protein